MLDALRHELQQVRAIELASILHWTPRLTSVRAPDGCKVDKDDGIAEDEAMRALFGCADIFIWLQNDTRWKRATHAIGQSEWVLAQWPGRSVHFHWFHDPTNPFPDHPATMAIDRVYEDAILRLDYGALRDTMRGLHGAMADSEVRITNAAGTDLRFRTTSRFMFNDGDASRAKVADALSARDREEEIPCGALRAIPRIDTVEGVIAFRGSFGFPAAGYGLDVNEWFDQGLRIVFEKGRVKSLQTDGDQAKHRSAMGSADRRQGSAWRIRAGAATRCCVPSPGRRFSRIMGSATAASSALRLAKTLNRVATTVPVCIAGSCCSTEPLKQEVEPWCVPARSSAETNAC